MSAFTHAWPWLTVALLGAFHGVNPGMGWLFAVALGLQERRGSAVVAAIGPIALGHALAVGMIALPVGLLGLFIPSRVLLVLGGVVLLGFAAFKVATRFRHPRWVGMRVRPHELVFWSFLMATAHGAGLMAAPLLIALGGGTAVNSIATGHAGHAHHLSAGAGDLTLLAAAVGLHTAVMLAVMALIALVVYGKIGVEILRRAWINLDLIWAGALTIAGGLTLGLGLRA